MDRNNANADEKDEQPTPAAAEMPDWMKSCQWMWKDECVSEEDWKWMEKVLSCCYQSMKDSVDK